MRLLAGNVSTAFLFVFCTIFCFGFGTAPVSGASTDISTLDSQENVTAADTGPKLQTASVTVDASPGSVTATSQGTDIELRQQLRRLPEQKGLFEASHRYQLPTELRQLEVTIPEKARVVSLNGFLDGAAPRTYRWDGTTAKPTLTYRLQGNTSIDQTGPIAGPGQFLFVDVGEWAVVSQPTNAYQWGWVGSERVGLDRTVSVDGPGAVGDVIAYLGEYDSYSHQAHGQQFELIVPEAAELAEPPAEIFESLGDASGTMRVGSRDETVFMIATPTRRIDWGVRGLQTGPSDIWVRDIERLDTADNVWVHEYVHSRQENTLSSDLRWFTEASATYYAAVLSLEQDRISFAQFKRRLSIGASESRFGNSILTDPGTWESNANYHVGTLVAGELDRQMRKATDRRQSLQEILRRLNAEEGVATAETLDRLLTATGGQSVATAGERLTTTTERPTMWDATEHRQLFEQPRDPARITYTPSKTDPFTVSGPYRNRSFESDSTPVFVPGETVSLGVDATNFGEQTSEYTATLRVNDRDVSATSDRLNAGETDRIVFNYTVGQRGEYLLSVGNIDLLATVRDPATPTVESLETDRTEITAGETIQLSADLSNQAARPAATTLRFVRGGEVIDSRSVRLGVEDSESVSIETTLPEHGTYVFSLGNLSSQTAVVTVTPSGSGVDDSGSGFGALTAGIAILSLAYIGLRERTNQSPST